MFGKKFKIFKILGFEVGIDLSWLVIAALIVWSFATGIFPHFYPGLPSYYYWIMGIVGAVGFFLSLIFHELTHSLFARKYGIRIKGITLFIFGGVAQMEEEPKTPIAEFVMAIAGPLSSFLLAGIFYILHFFAKQIGLTVILTGIFHYLSIINVFLAIFNLIPAFPLDGGRVLRSILWKIKKDVIWATKIASRLGIVFGTVLIILGIINVFTGGDFIDGLWSVLIGMFLNNASNSSYRQLVIKTLLENENVSRFITSPITVVPAISIKQFIEGYVYKYYSRMFPVVDEGKLLGCAHINSVKNIPKNKWDIITVKEVIKNCSPENTVSPQDSVFKALMIMNRTGNSQLMVTEGENLAGMIAQKDITKFLDLKQEVGN